jgi:hypothetical protein
MERSQFTAGPFRDRSRSSHLLQGGFEALRGHGQLPQASTRGVENGVGHNGSYGDDRRFAATRRGRLGILNQDGLDPGQPRKARDLVGIEVAIEHGTVLEGYLLSQGVTQAHGDTAFYLLARAVGIHSNTLILGADDPLHFYRPGAFVYHDLGYSRDVRARVNGADKADAATTRPRCRLPPELLGSNEQHTPHARIAQVGEAKLKRVLAQFAGQGVDVQM